MGQSITRSLTFPDLFYFLRFGHNGDHYAMASHQGEEGILCFRSIRDLDNYAEPFGDTPGMSRYDFNSATVDSARDFVREHFPKVRHLVLYEPGYVPGREDARLTIYIPPPVTTG